MNINREKLNRFMWYEDENNNIVDVPENEVAPKNPKIKTYHTLFPLTVEEKVYIYNPETGETEYAMEYGTTIMSCEDLIMAMVNSDEFRLREALILVSQCCERCLNALMYKYLQGEDGYPEYSEYWKKAGTVCEFCVSEESELPSTESEVETV